MRVALIEIEPMVKYPPAINVLKTLVDLGCDVSLYTLSLHSEIKQYCEENNVEVHEIGGDYVYLVSPIKKFVDLLSIRKKIWDRINYYENQDSLLWVFSTITLKHLGKELLKHNYILHLFELIERLYYFNHYFQIDLSLYCKRAKKVVVCEYNRAFITQTWLRLERAPIVLPNKPYLDNRSRYKKVTSSDEAANVLNKLSGKKIVLYQGIIDQERPLDGFIRAVDQLGDEYAFVIMSDHDVYCNTKSSNYYFINYIPAPKHLEVTSHAFIGVLSYVPTYSGYSSPLNAIYCAPNKTYEYAAFGIPMIGNDIPGLRYSLEDYKMGVCTDTTNLDRISDAIKIIEKEYNSYQENAINYYDETNTMEIIHSIIRDAENMEIGT